MVLNRSEVVQISTLLTCCQNGDPRLAKKTRNIREEDARGPGVDEMPSTREIEAMTTVPGTDLISSTNTWTKGKPKDICGNIASTCDRSPRRNSSAISIENPRITYVRTTAAFYITSAKYTTLQTRAFNLCWRLGHISFLILYWTYWARVCISKV